MAAVMKARTLGRRVDRLLKAFLLDAAGRIDPLAPGA